MERSDEGWWSYYFPLNLFPNKCCKAIWSYSCCCSSRDDDDDDEREVIVHMNNPEANAEYKFSNNFICTSKYTIWSFLPLALLFQFTKASNVYFLINMVFSLIPGVAPVNPATAIAPLVFVLAVALIKEGVEDIKRHKSDNKANALKVEVLRDGVLTEIRSRDVMAGDVIRIIIGEEVRADVVLLSSSVEEGQAFIDTCNLDGETNLKSRKALETTWPLNNVETVMETKVTIHTGPPDPGLLSWTGLMKFNDAELSLSIDQFLFRGCVLRNTDWVWGVVVFAGVDTKMFRNLKEKPPKSSNLDRKLNILIVVVFGIQNICLIIISSLSVWWNHKHGRHWYLDFFINDYKNGKLWGYRYLTYFILLSYFIPISLFVTTELCKVIQAQWMHVDAEMMEFRMGQWRRCVPNTSNLNEQLAMVKFIFSDKTGTLTENVMRFRKGNILGAPFDSEEEDATRLLLEPSHPMYPATREYFLALALCSTIQPFADSTKEDGLIYEGSSPDEVALVETAARMGFKLQHRTVKSITLIVEGVEKVYNILATLEFTPDRKMMSIVVEDRETGKLTLYNKGADSFVKPQLSTSPDVQSNLNVADVALTEMSSTGLRTLLVCAKDLSRPVFEEWHTKFMQAGKLLQNRSETVDRVCLEMERDMRLVGVTAIEDKLQDEVPETLSFFLNAGVVIWMLTGDKRETAVTIAATSTLCDPRSDYIDHIDIGGLDPASSEAVAKVGNDLHAIEQHVELKGTSSEKKCTFVVNGVALEIAMENYFELFLNLAQRVNSAVCCRLTPLQKANVVHMFQRSTGLTALAIGDGANDVSMIQEGLVGVGIIGLEGAQAALAADYAIPRFKHLRRLCAVHGRYSLLRNASCITVSFYKNILLSVIQVIFAAYTGFSGQTLFDGWLLTFYNIVLTSIPPFLMGIFEKDLPEEILMVQPQLFTPLADGLYFDAKTMAFWWTEAVVHAFLLFYSAYPMIRKRDATHTNISGSMSGTMIFCGMVFIVLTRFSMHIRYWQWLQFLGVMVSVAAFLLLVLVYSAIKSLFGTTTFYWQIYVLMSMGTFWIYLLLWVGTVVAIGVSVMYFRKQFFPTLRDRAEREFLRRHPGKL